MPKKTSATLQKKLTSAKKGGKTSTAKTTSNGTGDGGEAKRAARQAQENEQRTYVAKNYVDGDMTLGAVSKHLKITSGKAAFLAMQVRVERGEVSKIAGKSDDVLLKNIAAARAKADEFSSWGWLAARSGRSEGFIKTGLEAAGLYSPKAENIAQKRAGTTATKTSAKKTTGKKTGSKKVRGNA